MSAATASVVTPADSPDVHVHNHIYGDTDGLIRAIRSEIADPDSIRMIERTMGRNTSLVRGATWGR